MMNFAEGEKLLKEMNMASDEVDTMWNECVAAGHTLIANLNRCGKGWRDLNPHAIKTLPREHQKLKEEGKIK